MDVRPYLNTHFDRFTDELKELLRLPSVSADPAYADAVRQTREAALTDEAGTALDQRLQALGAAQRPATEHPLRFVRSATRAPQQAPRSP